MEEINYKLLLEKYIKYVSQAEGSDCITYGKDPLTDVVFTETEWDCLTKIATEINTKN